MNTVINFYIKVPQQLKTKEKLNIIAEKMSHYKFNKLPIEVLKIENRDNKKIAIINLKEHKWNQDKITVPTLRGTAGVTWKYDFFQGSTGSHFTSESLLKSFLQPDFDFKNNQKEIVAKLKSPLNYKEQIRCDLHPRWDRNGKKISFDSAHLGKRALCTIKYKNN
jgi:hypothetical protein